MWQRMREKAGIDKEDPLTWPDGYEIEERLRIPDVLACFTDRLVAAIEQLVGPRDGMACEAGASGRSTSRTGRRRCRRCRPTAGTSTTGVPSAFFLAIHILRWLDCGT